MNVYFNSIPLNFISNIKDRFLNLTVQNQRILAISSLVFAITAAIYIAGRCWNKTTVSQRPSNPLVPDLLAEIFRAHSYDPQNLPLLKIQFPESPLKKPITFITPSQMTSPLMRFTDDFGRHGIALHVKGKSNSTTRVSNFTIGEDTSSAQGISEVWFFYQPCANKPNLWKGNVSNSASQFMSLRHKATDHRSTPIKGWDDCPAAGSVFVSKSLFESLLTGQDPDFQLGGGDSPFNLSAQV